MAAPPAPLHWDLFCRVIDNYGDAGVCWRLAADLAARGHGVRLWIDDPAPLAFIAPVGAAGVEVRRWAADDHAAGGAAPGDVIVEAFGCDPPAGFVARMAAAARPPVWLNLEYLSAEDYVERSHGLPSPQRNGLTKWFFYPGFTAATGGLLREHGLLTARHGFDRDGWLASVGAARRDGERVVALFAYEHAPFATLMGRLADRPTLLLACAGAAQAPALAAAAGWPALRAVALPWLGQPQFDRLLWSADLNFVRGEDSLVRAIWAGAPFVWQIYPQHDDAHVAKLAAFVERWRAEAAPADALHATVQAAQLAWNGLGPWPAAWPDEAGWRAANGRWRDVLARRPDLVSRLLDFVHQARAAAPKL